MKRIGWATAMWLAMPACWVGLLTAAYSPARAAAAGQPVQVASFDRADRVKRADSPGAAGLELVLAGQWFLAPEASTGAHAGSGWRAPAMLLLHGCGGLYDRSGQPAARYTGLAAHLNALGVHALTVDSLTPRGERELCTQRTGARQVTMLQRRRDVLGALRWLAAQPGVDPMRIGVLGWSNGGSAVLAATNLRSLEVSAAPVRPSLAVAYYPGCQTELQRGYQPSTALLMLLGEADDWTPAAPCKALAAKAGQVELEAYPGAHHGFDGNAPVRLRRDVPNGAHPGQGVHVGADAPARAAAAQRLDAFLRQRWGADLKPTSIPQ